MSMYYGLFIFSSVLASASDDLRFILWDPFRHRKLHTFETGHHGNIFTVKFLPKTKDNIVVTGAADCRIRVHDVESRETTLLCSCHTGRVKRVATAPNVPYLFWSAAEDGMIMWVVFFISVLFLKYVNHFNGFVTGNLIWEFLIPAQTKRTTSW